MDKPWACKPALPGRTGDRLAGKVAVVTGIAAGIGRGIALLFAQHGANVIGCDIDAAGAQATLQTAADAGLAIDSLHPLDLTQPSASRQLFDTVAARYGGIDILVNAAAFGAFEWLEQIDYESQWRRPLVGEIDIVFLACQAAWPHLKARGGSIINFASANARMALPLSPALAHCAGKGAVLAMSRQLAMEGGPHGIRVNTISPALVETAATRQPLGQIAASRTRCSRSSWSSGWDSRKTSRGSRFIWLPTNPAGSPRRISASTPAPPRGEQLSLPFPNVEYHEPAAPVGRRSAVP